MRSIILSGSTSVALSKCAVTLFRVDSHYRKGGTHTYNMMKAGNYVVSIMKNNINPRIC